MKKDQLILKIFKKKNRKKYTFSPYQLQEVPSTFVSIQTTLYFFFQSINFNIYIYYQILPDEAAELTAANMPDSIDDAAEFFDAADKS